MVDEPESTDEIWWGKVNQRLAPEKFRAPEGARAGLSAGPGAVHAGPLCRRRPGASRAGAAGDDRGRGTRCSRATCSSARRRPSWRASSPTTSSCTRRISRPIPASMACAAAPRIALSFAEHIIVIAGTEYAGEIKKSIFTVMNWLLPAEGVLPMHCSANVGPRTATWRCSSACPAPARPPSPPTRRRTLIGDDEHGWGPQGVFNFEGGCYAKVINLSAEAEPEIWAATHRFGTVLENVVGRRARPSRPRRRLADREHALLLPGRVHPERRAVAGVGGQPRNVVMLTADAFGVLPPIAKLTPAQAMYHFLSRLHRARRRHREGPRRRAAGDVLHLLRRALPAAPAGGLWPDAGRPDRPARRRLLAGQHRLERRRSTASAAA